MELKRLWKRIDFRRINEEVVLQGDDTQESLKSEWWEKIQKNIKDKMKLRSYGRDWKYRSLSENWESKIHFKQMNSDTKFVPRDHPEGHIYQEKNI